jgi:AcrR family transcriptional regulator
MKRGRRPGVAGATRLSIVRAAQALFARRGFQATTMRAIASRAGVDAALLHYFFDSKEKLFRAAVEVPDRSERFAPLLADGPSLAHYYLAELFPRRGDAVAALLRAAVADPTSLPALRRSLEAAVLSPAAQALGGRDARLRAELAGALVVGLFVCRELVRMEPLAQVPPHALTPRVGRALDALLTAPSSRGAAPTRSARRRAPLRR